MNRMKRSLLALGALLVLSSTASAVPNNSGGPGNTNGVNTQGGGDPPPTPPKPPKPLHSGLDLNNMPMATMGGDGPAPDTTQPPGATTPPGGSTGGGGGGGGSGPASASPDAAAAEAGKAYRSDILPGQMDAINAGGVPDAGRTTPVQRAASVDGITINTSMAPAMLGGVGGSRGSSRHSDLLGGALTRMRMRDYRGAAAYARQAIADDPKDDHAHALLAQASNHLGDFGAAEASASDAIKLNPGNAAAWQNRAWAQVHQKKYPEALEAAEQAVALKPNAASNYAVKAYAEAGLGRKDAAMADLERAASLDPRFLGRVEHARKTGEIFNPDEELAGLTDEMAGGAAGAGKEGGSKSGPIKVGGIALLALGLWAGLQLGMRAARPKVAAPAAQKFPPTRFGPPPQG